MVLQKVLKKTSIIFYFVKYSFLVNAEINDYSSNSSFIVLNLHLFIDSKTHKTRNIRNCIR